ncbi:hypothetical protein PR048_019539 [Dryococelus australis]|uniref:SHSP domain-containing protein n=1 Tax=Dryococelus australis TaxID=614101 RepID=A0ABQ9H3R2_9NEOP|nr:hypothetical protein PR048_019539 [Dryococelus australis]
MRFPKLVPATNLLHKVCLPINDRACRNIWGYPLISQIVRDIERQTDRLERDFLRFSPLRRLLPRQIPIEGSGVKDFRLTLDVQGYKPEEIALALKDGVLCIEAKMERSGEDESKFFQAVVKRKFTLPDNIDAGSLKSFMRNDGILTIEASLKPLENPKELPISKE